MSVKELVARELETLTEAKLKRVAEFIAFIKFQERFEQVGNVDEARLAALYAEFASESRDLTGEVSSDYFKGLSLDDLLMKITDQNLHRESETGPAVGNEIW
ncbi:MAG TPA: hypothetical protein VJ302_18880 [Blastocatellia bacterium]|nr:hypothetical protein [Blastocatellia bacterium]